MLVGSAYAAHKTLAAAGTFDLIGEALQSSSLLWSADVFTGRGRHQALTEGIMRHPTQRYPALLDQITNHNLDLSSSGSNWVGQLQGGSNPSQPILHCIDTRSLS
eukprot:1158855-Pelagomonas_calceolata.AAC.5